MRNGTQPRMHLLFLLSLFVVSCSVSLGSSRTKEIKISFFFRLACNYLQSNHVNFIFFFFGSRAALLLFGAQLVVRCFFLVFGAFCFGFFLFDHKCISMYCVCLFTLHTSTVISSLSKHAPNEKSRFLVYAFRVQSFATNCASSAKWRKITVL